MLVLLWLWCGARAGWALGAPWLLDNSTDWVGGKGEQTEGGGHDPHRGDASKDSDNLGREQCLVQLKSESEVK